MKILIAYAGKTGTTEKCAGIIAQRLKNVTIVNLSQEVPEITGYDLIIIGSSVRYGKLDSKARDFINNNQTSLLNKKVAYYICCCFTQSSKEYFENSITKKLLDNAVIYDSFGGEMDINKQHGIDKLITKFVSKVADDKVENEILYENVDKFIEVLKGDFKA